jgi:uroporphyrinogen-III decarboxylase
LEKSSEFTCGYEDSAVWPISVLKHKELIFPEVHKEARLMALLAEKVKEANQDVFCRLPLCATVEAEALGASINLGDALAGPRMEKYVLTDIAELGRIRKIDLGKGRIKEVLDAVEELTGRGHVVSLNVEGAFTISNCIIDPSVFYKALKKDDKELNQFLNRLEENLILYINEGIKRGAKIISFADPNGNVNIVGPQLFTEMSNKFTLPLLRRFQKETSGAVMHLCGRLSLALIKTGLAEAKAITMGEESTYGEYIKKVISDFPDCKLIGNNCMNRAKMIEKSKRIWKIEIK